MHSTQRSNAGLQTYVPSQSLEVTHTANSTKLAWGSDFTITDSGFVGAITTVLIVLLTDGGSRGACSRSCNCSIARTSQTPAIASSTISNRNNTQIAT